MKPSIAITLGSGVFAVLMAAYLFAYATTVRDPVEWKDGDVIIQESKVEKILPVFAAEGGFMHVGVVEARPGGASVVIEAADKVVETPMREFLSRGDDGAYAVYRLNGLTPEQGKTVVDAARRQIGKPNDYFLSKSWDQLYSSELVRLAFNDAGIDVGRMQKLGRVPGDLTVVRSQFMRQWSNNDDCHKRNLSQEQCWTMFSKQDVVTPLSIVSDTRMTKIYEVAKAEKKGFTLSRAAEKKNEAPAP
jgi:hypothetical protein